MSVLKLIHASKRGPGWLHSLAFRGNLIVVTGNQPLLCAVAAFGIKSQRPDSMFDKTSYRKVPSCEFGYHIVILFWNLAGRLVVALPRYWSAKL